MDESPDSFDAAILVTRYGTPLFPEYMKDAVFREDLSRVRFALSQNQDVSYECYVTLLDADDATLLNEVLRAKKVGGSIPMTDQALIKQALHEAEPHAYVIEVLAEHSIFVCSGNCEFCVLSEED